MASGNQPSGERRASSPPRRGGAHVVELKRLDERVREILEESGPAEVEFLLAEFVEDDEVLHGAIARGVYAVEEPEVHAGLDGLDKAVADDVDDPAKRVGELAFAGTGEREGIADRNGEIIWQMIPRHAERSVAFAPAKDEVRASVEALVDFKSGQWPSGRDETKLPQAATGERALFPAAPGRNRPHVRYRDR